MTDGTAQNSPDPTVKDPADRPGFYHPSQIVAHWTIVFLLLFQFATGGTLQADYALWEGGVQPIHLSGALYVHGLIGTSILLLMLWRLAIRLTHPVPPPPRDESKALQIVSRATHWAFYAILIAMPLAGWAAIATGLGWIADAHALASKALLALIALHFLGAMYHAFKRDGVVKRVLRQDPAGQYDSRMG